MERQSKAVVCDRIEVAYDGAVAVDGISFDVDAGEMFGLLGPNGAGKTSVVRVLSTMVDAAGGSALVAGIPLTDPDAVRAVIGVLPESNGYPGPVTAFDYITYFGRLYGQSHFDARTRAGELLGEVGLDAVAGNPIRTFSRGMRQRLGIARALVNRPKVLFLDEPTLGLDPAGREDVLARLSALASEAGAGVVLCSHLLDDVERVCDRIAILHQGKIVSAGTVAEVIGQSEIASAASISVAPDYVAAAIDVLETEPRVAAATANAARRGHLDLQLAEPVQDGNQLLSALLGAGIPITGLQSHRARLSDAFLALTGTEGSTPRG